MTQPQKPIMTVDTEARGRLTPLRIFECPDCSALLAEDRMVAHAQWHKAHPSYTETQKRQAREEREGLL